MDGHQFHNVDVLVLCAVVPLDEAVRNIWGWVKAPNISYAIRAAKNLPRPVAEALVAPNQVVSSGTTSSVCVGRMLIVSMRCCQTSNSACTSVVRLLKKDNQRDYCRWHNRILIPRMVEVKERRIPNRPFQRRALDEVHPKTSPFLHAISFEWTTRLQFNYLKQFSFQFHI